MYIKSLFKEKAEGESRKDQIKRRLAFKIPIAVRYSLVGSLFVAAIHSFIARKVYFGRYLLFATPVFMAGICFDEIAELRKLKGEEGN